MSAAAAKEQFAPGGMHADMKDFKPEASPQNTAALTSQLGAPAPKAMMIPMTKVRPAGPALAPTLKPPFQMPAAFPAGAAPGLPPGAWPSLPVPIATNGN